MNAQKDEARQGNGGAVEALRKQLSKVRTGKANTALLDPIKVDYYGSATPLSQVAAISCPDAKSFLIAPWEASIIKEIEAAIVKSDIGMTPLNDGKVIRLKVPDLTEERRKGLVKQTKKLVEEARVAVRMCRRNANEIFKKAVKDKELGEDESKRSQEEIQKLTDKFISELDKIADQKEKDIMTI